MHERASETSLSDDELVAEQEAVRAARAQRDRELTPGERLERLHVMCAQLATLQRAEPEPPR